MEDKQTVSAVLGTDAIVYVRGGFGLDTLKYSWVEDFIRDKTIRTEIERLEQQIREVAGQPRHKDEVQNMFKNWLQQRRMEGVESIKGLLLAVQNRERLFNSDFTKILIEISAVDFTSGITKELFSSMPDGIKSGVIDNRIKEIRRRIEELKNKIDSELSPRERWYHRDNGFPEPYPMGCRWTKFVDTWKQIARRFNAPVNINACVCSPEEAAAYTALEIGSLMKLPPVRDPKNLHYQE